MKNSKASTNHRSITDWLLVAGVVASALVFVGTRLLADDAIDIEYQGVNTVATYDGNTDDAWGGNNQDVIVDTILSQPGTFGGHTYTSWSILAADASGSLNIVSSATSLAGLGWTPTIGQNISVTGTYSPFGSIPQLANVTAETTHSSGNQPWSAPGTPWSAPPPAPPWYWPGTYVPAQIATIPQVWENTGTATSGFGPTTYGPISQNLAGYLVEIRDVTLSGAGSLTFFPATNLTLYLNDTTGHQLTMCFDPTSYACDGQMVGSPIPDNGPFISGPFNADGILTAYPSVSGTTTNWQDEFIPTMLWVTPEPSSFTLVGIGLLSLLAVIRRRHSHHGPKS
jgi:hypothetical protein